MNNSVKFILIIIGLILISNTVFSACYFGAGWNCSGCNTTVINSTLATYVRNGASGWSECKYDDGKCQCRCDSTGKMQCADISDRGSEVCHIATHDYLCCVCSGTSCNPNNNGLKCDGCKYISVSSVTETCNNIDDDCDGLVDEGLFLSTGCNQVGECAGAIKTCSAGNWSTCSKQPTQEICDGLDNDCDGTIDNGFECAKGSTNCNDNCTFATKNTTNCTGTIPQNAETNYGTTGGTFTQTWNGTNWSPETKNHSYNETPQECAWKCKQEYFYYEGTCRSDTQQATCTGNLIQNSQWNDNGRNGKYYQIYSNGEWTPNNLSTHYNETPENCAWTCINGYHYSNNSCIPSTKTNPCNLTDYNNILPQNAKWNDGGKNGYYTQTWTNNTWLPTTKKAMYSEPTTECAFDCITPSKTCDLDETTYCGKGTQNCEYGYWGTCTQGTATICTQNQHCTTTGCQFCLEGTKNCDLNLLTGCETNTNSDNNNCGSCGNTCVGGQTCVDGICKSQENPIDVEEIDLCENMVCPQNSYCNPNTGACICDYGYYGCDSDMSNGCETTSCSTIECTDDSDCAIGNICSDGTCIINGSGTNCSNDFECESNEFCYNNVCTTLNCGTGFDAQNNSCVCSGIECGETCHTSLGVCCKNTWNEGLESCEYNLDPYLAIVNNSGDPEAINLIGSASTSYSLGNIKKGNAEANIAKLKSLITLNNSPKKYEESYQLTLVALNEKDYDTANSLALSTIEKMNSEEPTQDLLPIIIIGLILIILIAYFAYSKFAPPKEIQEE